MDESQRLAAEKRACCPSNVKIEDFNSAADLPFGLTVDHLCSAMNEFIEFIGFINQQLNGRGIVRLETMLMAANFSSIVGEFMTSAIPKYCAGLSKNQYHNGHPDLVPTGLFKNNSVQHAKEGIEVKGSRYLQGWQGHNAEEAWLMVFCFESGRPTDDSKGIKPTPFRYLKVVGAQLDLEDWTFAGRSDTSRRTITAAVNRSGYDKMSANWIYRAPVPKGPGLLDLG